MMVLSEKTGDQLRTLHCQIQAFRQFQQLLTARATLADVSKVLACVEADYGAESLLENVIQHLVAEHLALQIECRKTTHRA
jgi:hypothetical protein